MSHHYSGPDFGFPQGDARLDFTDLYAFPKPGDAGKSILIMNVHPSAGENPPGPTTSEPFAPEALYELKIDTNGDAVADIAYRVRFSAFEGGEQTAIVRRIDGPQAAGTGDDGGWIEVERGARPAQAVILVEEKDAYLAGEPANDERFLAAFAHALEHTGGYTPAEAKRVAGTLLPDVLSYNPMRPASFPDNGRTLTDDAFDVFIRILTNGKVTEDNVGAHGDLLLAFPYVGPPHQSRAMKAPHKTTATQNQK